MPVNPGYEYAEAQKKVDAANTPIEKIKAYQELLSVTPTHKGAEVLRKEIKTKISKLRERLEKEKARKKGGHGLAVKKEGAAQVTLIGLTNSGKSTLINQITNAKPEIADYEFTTQKPFIAIMDYEGIKIQIIEIPAIFKGFSKSDKGPAYAGIMKSSDLVVIVLDGKRNCEEDFNSIKEELEKCNIILKKAKDKNKEHKNSLIVINKVMNNFKSSYNVCWHEDLKQGIWNLLNLIYVYTKQPGKPKEFPPVALKKGSKVKDLAEVVHKDLLKLFKYARIWGKSIKHDGANAGLEHILAEGDTIEVHLK